LERPNQMDRPRAGIEPGDLIVRFDDKDIKDAAGL
jgi:hypothetical protein